MDKSTLSNYGWIVAVVVVLAIMVSLATPFGQVIRGNVESQVTKLKDTASGALDNAGGASSFDDLSGGGSGGAGGPVEVITNYTQSEIAASTLLFAAGETDSIYVVIERSSDLSTLTVTKNGNDSDGKMGTGPYVDDDYSSVVIKNGVVNIGAAAFCNNSYLTNVTIPSSVTSIGDYAFSCSGITDISIPSSVTSIGESVFQTTEITDIYYDGTQEQWNSIAKNEFWNADCQEITVHCSDGDIILPETRI